MMISSLSELPPNKLPESLEVPRSTQGRILRVVREKGGLMFHSSVACYPDLITWNLNTYFPDRVILSFVRL